MSKLRIASVQLHRTEIVDRPLQLPPPQGSQHPGGCARRLHQEAQEVRHPEVLREHLPGAGLQGVEGEV